MKSCGAAAAATLPGFRFCAKFEKRLSEVPHFHNTKHEQLVLLVFHFVEAEAIVLSILQFCADS